jgi:hypothetical protein
MLSRMHSSRRLAAVGWTTGTLLILAWTRPALAQSGADAAPAMPSDAPPSAPWAPQELLEGPPGPEVVYERQWYGRPIVIADVLSLGSLTCALAIAQFQPDAARGLALVGLGGYLAAGPIVHFTEGRVGIGFASLGMRAGAPAVGMFAGMLIGAVVMSNSCSGEGCGLAGLAIGGVIGLVGGGVTAAIIDAAALARKPVPISRLAMVLLPTFNPVTGQTGLALRGAW